MKKEDILQASREENKNKDLAIIEIENKGAKIAAISSLLLATIYYCMKIIIQGQTDNGFYSLIAIYCTALYGYKGIKTKNKLELICFVIWGTVSIITMITYILEIIKGAI